MPYNHPLRPSIRELQRGLVNRLLASADNLDNGDIASVAGVDDTAVSKWYTKGVDGREITLDNALRLAHEFGWDRVFGVYARADGWDLARTEGRRAATLRDGFRRVRRTMAEVLGGMEDAEDPAGDSGEGVSHTERRAVLDQLLAHREEVDAAVRALEASMGLAVVGGGR